MGGSLSAVDEITRRPTVSSYHKALAAFSASVEKILG